jgi:transcriptional regulator with XRE-family HTH domain
MNYGKAIKTIRAAKGISQKQLSTALELDTSYLSRIEKGERTPSIPLLEKISKKLEVPFYLLALLSSEKEDLKTADNAEVEKISKNLLLALLEK